MTCACIYKYTHIYVFKQYHDYTDTGWRRLIGSPKLQIIFHKRATKYRSLLRKMTYQDKGSYESSPPCTKTCVCVCIYTHDVCCVYIQRDVVGKYVEKGADIHIYIYTYISSNNAMTE